MGKSFELHRMLQSAAWAEGLTPDQRRHVVDEVHERHVDAGAVVWPEGAPADHWMGVVDGMVKVDSVDAAGRETTFICVTRGGWLGEGSVIKGETLRYEVVALHRSHLCMMPRATFLRLLQSSLPFNHFIIDQLNARLGQFLALIESSRSRDTVAQVARCMAEMFNPQLNPRPDFEIHISQQEIGRLCGLSRQVASRALHQLEAEGLVQVHHNRVEVLDVSGLQHFVGLH